MKTIPN